MKVTHIDYAILGLLMSREMTGYQIRMVFDKTALGNFSSSPGTIYPALKRMLKLKLVERGKTPGSSPGPFAITKAGMKALRSWILKPVTRDDVAKGFDLILLRIAFLDLTNSAKRREAFLKSFSSEVQKYIMELEKYYRTESSNMPKGGRLAFEHGMESYKSTLIWIRKVRSVYRHK
jgi:PadR family transcriptional regulator, phenolic acid-responsive transcriptional regulator